MRGGNAFKNLCHLVTNKSRITYAQGSVIQQVYNNKRYYNVTRQKESALVIGGIGIALAAAGAQYAIKAYKNMPQTAKETESTPESENEKSNNREESSKKSTQQAKSSSSTAKEGSNSSSDGLDATMEGIFSSISGSWAEIKKSMFSKGYYDGGFEDKMSRREAALILGVRESTSPERIKEAHRRVLLLNHPDRGGSAYMAAKINEAKDLLLKGTGQK